MEARYVISATFVAVGAASAIWIATSGADRVALTPQATGKQVWSARNYKALLPAPAPAESTAGFTARSQSFDSATGVPAVADSRPASSAPPVNYADLGVLPAI